MAHPHSNLQNLYDNVEIDISALAAITGVIATSKIDGSRGMGFRTLMQEGSLEYESAALVGGPVLVGMAGPSLSLTEIEEAIEADPQSSVDRPAVEQISRPIFILGFLQAVAKASVKSATTFRKKFQWSFPEGTQLTFFAYNTDLTTAIGASTQIKIFCKHTGVWLRD